LSDNLKRDFIQKFFGLSQVDVYGLALPFTMLSHSEEKSGATKNRSRLKNLEAKNRTKRIFTSVEVLQSNGLIKARLV